MRDLTPEHTKRATETDKPLNPDVCAAYRYVECATDTADLHVGGAPAWHGWALREAFLAGVSYARQVSVCQHVWINTPNLPLLQKCEECGRTRTHPDERKAIEEESVRLNKQ